MMVFVQVEMVVDHFSMWLVQVCACIMARKFVIWAFKIVGLGIRVAHFFIFACNERWNHDTILLMTHHRQRHRKTSDESQNRDVVATMAIGESDASHHCTARSLTIAASSDECYQLICSVSLCLNGECLMFDVVFIDEQSLCRL